MQDCTTIYLRRLKQSILSKGNEDPTTNVDFDKDKEERYNKNLHILKRILQVVKLCAEQRLPSRRHCDNKSLSGMIVSWLF